MQDLTIPHAGLLDTETHATILDSQTAPFQGGGAQTITCSFCEKKKQKKPQQQKTNQPFQTPGGKHPGSIPWHLAKGCAWQDPEQ